MADRKQFKEREGSNDLSLERLFPITLGKVW